MPRAETNAAVKPMDQGRPQGPIADQGRPQGPIADRGLPTTPTLPTGSIRAEPTAPQQVAAAGNNVAVGAAIGAGSRLPQSQADRAREMHRDVDALDARLDRLPPDPRESSARVPEPYPEPPPPVPFATARLAPPGEAAPSRQPGILDEPTAKRGPPAKSVATNADQSAPKAPASQAAAAPAVKPAAAQTVGDSGGLVAPGLGETRNHASGRAQRVTPTMLPDGKSTTTWGWVDGRGLQHNGGTTSYRPIDTMTVSVKGQTRTIRAYANVDAQGNPVAANGPFQCTALVSSYLADLGFKNAPRQLPNGRLVASYLGSGANAEYFLYSKLNGANVNPPRVGTIVSMETNESKLGHVAIVKGLTQNADGSLTAKLLEQNMHIAGQPGFAVNREVRFARDANGGWSAAHKIDPAGPNSYKVIDWVTPTTLP